MIFKYGKYRILLTTLVFILAFGVLTAFADSNGFDFESFSLGNVNGQSGWSKTGSYDVAVVSNIYGYASFGTKSLRISNAITSGSFGDQTFSASLTDEAGEASAVSDGQSGGTRQPYFSAQWDFASTIPGAEQPGLQFVASPDRGDGARMSYVQIADKPAGIEINFYDYVPGYPLIPPSCCAGFRFTTIASGVDRSTPHTLKIEMIFHDGVENDVVKVFLDGNLIHTGTSWEDYFRIEEGNPTRPVDSILFRVGGTAAPATSGNGFLIDNLTISSGPVPCTTDCYVDVNTGSDSNSGLLGSPFKTIQKGVNTVYVGGTVHVAAGLYPESVVVNKRLTLDGAGNGTNPLLDTVIDPASPGITITAGGASAVSRLVISDLTVTGASGGSFAGSGILIQEGSATIEHITFDEISSVSNSGHGIGINHTGTVGDIEIINSDLSNNGGTGFRIPTSIGSFSGLYMTGGTVNNNGNHGVITGPSGSPNVDDINIDGTSFTGNGDAGTTGDGDISLFGFNGNASIKNVTINADAYIALQIRGIGVGSLSGYGPISPAGTISLDNVAINGTTTYSALSLMHYSDVSGISFNDVTIDTTSAFGLYLETLADGLDLGDTKFDGTYAIQRTISNASLGDVDATGTTFVGAADNFAIEDRIGHAIDVAGGGLVTFVPNNDYVTVNSFIAPLTTSPLIQRGINEASPGWTVNVGPGIFNESININKSVTVLGRQTGIDPACIGPVGAESIIQGNNITALVQINANNVVFDGLTVRGNTQSVGIYAPSTVSGYKILNSTITDNVFGIYPNSNGTTQVVIQHNYIHDNDNLGAANGNGIYADQGSKNMLVDSNCIENNFNIGILFTAVPGPQINADLTISNNKLTNNGGAILIGSADNTVISTNEITDSSGGSDVVLIGDTTDSEVSDNTVTDGVSRFFIAVSTFGLGNNSDVTVTGNTVNKDVGELIVNRATIELDSVLGTSDVSNNDITFSGTFGGGITFSHGILLKGALTGNVTINENTLTHSAASPLDSVGIRLNGDLPASSIITAEKNLITGFKQGVLSDALAPGIDVNINLNNIVGNSVNGVENGAGEKIDATRNWWGNASGPGPVGPGSGDKVSTNVSFCPWLNAAYPGGVATNFPGGVATTSTDGHTTPYCTIEEAMFASVGANQQVHVTEGLWPGEIMNRDYTDSPDLLVIATGDRDNTVVDGIQLGGSGFDGLTFKNFTFTGNSAGYSDYNVTIDSAGNYADLAFVDNIFDGENSVDRGAIFGNQGWDGFTLDNNIFRNYENSAAYAGITNYSLVFMEAQNGTGNNYLVTNNEVINVKHLNSFEAYRWQNVDINNNEISGLHGRILVWSDAILALDNVDIYDNTLNLTDGTVMFPTTGIGVFYTTGDVNIHNNEVNDASTCITTIGVSDLEVLDNDLNNCAARGFLFDDDFVAPVTAVITGNTFNTGPVGAENRATIFELNVCNNTFINIVDKEFENPGPFANCEPGAVNDSLEVTYLNDGSVDVLANDSDSNDDPLTVTGATNGVEGTTSVASPQVSYQHVLNTPVPEGTTISDSFTYDISDGNGGTDTATVNVTIGRLKIAPDCSYDSEQARRWIITNPFTSLEPTFNWNTIDPNDIGGDDGSQAATVGSSYLLTPVTSNVVSISVGGYTNSTSAAWEETCVGDIEVKKVIDWNGYTPIPNTSFEICVGDDCRNFVHNTVETYTVPIGTYDVDETAPGSYWTVSGEGEVNVVFGETVDVTITNKFTPTCTYDPLAHLNATIESTGNPNEWRARVFNTSYCKYDVGFASYKKTGPNQNDQILHSSDTELQIPNGETILILTAPDCAAQLDVFFDASHLGVYNPEQQGNYDLVPLVLPAFNTNSYGPFGNVYGQRLLAFKHISGDFCQGNDNPPPPPNPDVDNDGVKNEDDDCPNTPPNTPVDPQGCTVNPPPPPPVDTDGDGVPDSVDECDDVAANTANGCPPPPPLDSDGDGVPDSVDECDDVAANTANGCPLPPPPPLDSDGDGVPDSVDECDDVAANTANGCPLPPPPPPTCEPNPDADLRNGLTFIHDANTNALTIKGQVKNQSVICSYDVGLASYSKVNDNVDDQSLYDSDTGTVDPGEQITFTITIPDCLAQVDLFYGDVIYSFAGGVRYGSRLLDAKHVWFPNFCGAQEPEDEDEQPPAEESQEPQVEQQQSLVEPVEEETEPAVEANEAPAEEGQGEEPPAESTEEAGE